MRKEPTSPWRTDECPHRTALRVLWRRHRLQICQGRKACGMLVAEMPKSVRAVMEAIHSSLSLCSYFFTMDKR